MPEAYPVPLADVVQRLSSDQQRLLTEQDRRCVWHPFTQHDLWNRADPLIIVAGEREHLIDADGRRYIDGNSSLWCNIHGHRRIEIDQAIIEQLGRIAHTTQLGLASPPAIRLAKRLVDIAPSGLTKVFFSDDGSTSVEVACKLAYGYWHHVGQPQRDRFIALREAYHGDTIGSVSLGGIDLFHRVYRPLLFKTEFAPSPYCYRCPLGRCRETCDLVCADEVGRLLDEHQGRIAAVVVEPLIQAAGGMIAAPPGHLKRIREHCDRANVLLIADEVATGFGRTGRMFAVGHENVSPDLLCLSKGLTGGYLPLAATLATRTIYESFLGPIDSGRTFYHGHTYTGNPLGCAAALASLDLFEKDRTFDLLPDKIGRLAHHLRRLAGNPRVGDVRQVGLMAGIELVRDKATREAYPYRLQIGARVCLQARRYGVITRPLADTIVIVPPLAIALENLDALMTTIERCINEVATEAAEHAVDGLE
ncbi:MAG TPA: adenosylmethionine--8-amino-7-oxononanoate transaminase [Phycisphaerae bacterium]|nr:adenosylmethionine--8-amino-7-oxononanoate transaminase [Phycisphaerae bacterium]